MDINMFYNAKPNVFAKAKMLRLNMTQAEKVLWNELRSKKLGIRFKAQHPIDIYIVDFYCHKAKLVIELDGRNHELNKEYDNGRSDELNRFGITVIRFENVEVFENLDDVIKEIKKHIL